MKLDWKARQKICVGIARGLEFLHEGSMIRMVHRDIKTPNVLLDADLNAKISDFGLARIHEEEHTHISTKVAGTMLVQNIKQTSQKTYLSLVFFCNLGDIWLLNMYYGVN